jgi:hypothetical protein
MITGRRAGNSQQSRQQHNKRQSRILRKLEIAGVSHEYGGFCGFPRSGPDPEEEEKESKGYAHFAAKDDVWA